jgi:hypothetical protein
MLRNWLAVIAEHYPQHGDVTELAVIGYVEGLRDLSPQEMSLGFSQALMRCKFRPTAADVLEGLRVYRERQAITSEPKSATCSKCEGTDYTVVERGGYRYAQKCDHL